MSDRNQPTKETPAEILILGNLCAQRQLYAKLVTLAKRILAKLIHILGQSILLNSLLMQTRFFHHNTLLESFLQGKLHHQHIICHMFNQCRLIKHLKVEWLETHILLRTILDKITILNVYLDNLMNKNSEKTKEHLAIFKDVRKSFFSTV